MFEYDRLRTVHVELTDKCQAACPMCSRNFDGGREIDELDLTEIGLEDFQFMIPPELVRRLHKLYMCGNFGDPAIARDCLEIFRYLRETNPDITLSLHTNGGMRRPEWWTELGRIFSSGTGRHGTSTVHFGIDGLEDTNHIYRRNVQWNKLMDNVSAYIGAGGRAEWDFLVFKHNQHQLQQVHDLAKDMGFFKLIIKATSRFMNQTSWKELMVKPVVSRDGTFEYWLEKTDLPEWENHNASKIGRLAASGELQRMWNTTEIDCKAVREGMIYLSATGHVFPCCWLDRKLHVAGGMRSPDVLGLLERTGGMDCLDARKRSIREIVESDFFRSVSDSWSCTLSDGRLKSCARICGKASQLYSGQQVVTHRFTPMPSMK